MRWHPKQKEILNKKRNKVWEVINLFELQNKFSATQPMARREFLSAPSKKKCVGEMGKGKLQIKEEISLLRIASLWGPFVSDVSVNFFASTRCSLWPSLATLTLPTSRNLIPRKNQTPVEWKVLFSNVWLTCVLCICAENGHISSDSLFFLSLALTVLLLRYFLMKTTTATSILTG